MKFTGITFSGPDSDTPIGTLLELQQKFPYMEVGVLWSLSRAGQPRYADRAWIEEASERGLNFAIHLCGKVARDLVENCGTPTVPGTPRRVQINCNGMNGTPAWYRGFESIQSLHDHGLEFIVQTCDGIGAYWIGMAVGEGGHRCVPLFDKSGGKGESPTEWPEPLPYTRCGYAGGIGVDNVAATVEEIKRKKSDQSFWIDMESKVRTGDVFDLSEVVHILGVVDSLIDRR